MPRTTIQPGRLNTVIAIQSFTASRDDYGDETGGSWAELGGAGASTLRAEVVRLTGREVEHYRSMVSDLSIVFRIRARSGITSGQRVAYTENISGAAQRFAYIKAVLNEGNEGVSMLLLCGEEAT